MRWSVFSGTDADAPKAAVVFILLALTFLSLQDGLVKFTSGATSLWQFQMIRSVANLAIILIGLRLFGSWATLWPERAVPVFFRTAAIMATMVFFFAGAPFLTLPEMGAGLYTYPIFMTILGVLFLGERVGPWRGLAIVMAGVGAFFIVRPGGNAFHLAQILPVFAGFFYSINATILRKYCRQESPVTMAAWSGFGFLIVSTLGGSIVALADISQEAEESWPFLLTAWPTLSAYVVGLAILCAFCNVTGNVLIVKAYQSADLSGLAAIDYSYLIFATIWGYAFFSGLPDGATILGMTLIAAAGILTAWRQRRDQITSP